jgi:hypothetical protein
MAAHEVHRCASIASCSPDNCFCARTMQRFVKYLRRCLSRQHRASRPRLSSSSTNDVSVRGSAAAALPSDDDDDPELESEEYSSSTALLLMATRDCRRARQCFRASSRNPTRSDAAYQTPDQSARPLRGEGGEDRGRAEDERASSKRTLRSRFGAPAVRTAEFRIEEATGKAEAEAEAALAAQARGGRLPIVVFLIGWVGMHMVFSYGIMRKGVACRFSADPELGSEVAAAR